MGSIVARLRVILGADVDEAVQGVGEVDRGLDNLAKQGSRVGDVFKGVFGAQLLQSGINAFRNLAKEAVGVYSSYESLSLSLTQLSAKEMLVSGEADSMAEAMNRSGGAAEQLLGWVEELAMISPFDAQGVTNALRTAMAYGFTTEEAKRLTAATIDYASASGASVESMNSIALALGQIKAKGSLAGQEVLQLVNAGVDVNGTLARAFNVSTEEIMRMRDQGLIPADQAIEAIVQTLEVDFAGAAANASDTFGGLISTLDEVKDIGLREFFGGVFEELKPVMQELIELMSDPAMIENLQESGKALGEFVGTSLTGLMDLVQWFGSLDDGTKDLILTTAAMSLAMGPVTKGLTSLSNGIGGIAQMIPAFSAGMDGAGKAIGASGAAAGGAAASMGLYAAALVAVVAAGIKIKETADIVAEGASNVDSAISANVSSAETAQEAYDKWVDSIARMNKIYEEEASVAKLFVPINKMRKDSLDDLSKTLAGTSSSYDEYVTLMRSALLASGVLTYREDEMLRLHSDTGYAVDMLAGKYGLVTEAMYGMGQAATDTIDPQSDAIDAMDEAAEAAENATEATDELTEAKRAAQEAAEAEARAHQELISALYSSGNAADYFSGRLDALMYNLAVDVEDLKTLGSGFDNLFAQGMIDADQLVDANSFLGVESVLQELEGGLLTTWEANRTLRDSFGLTWTEAQEYIKGARDPMDELSELLGGLDVNKILEMSDNTEDFAEKLEISYGWAQDLAEEVEGLNGMTADINIRMNYTGADIVPQLELTYNRDINGNGIIGQADGGDWMVRRPTLFLAGEAGPERAIFIPQHKRDLEPVGGAEGSAGNDARLQRLEDLMISLQMTFERMPERIADAIEVR